MQHRPISSTSLKSLIHFGNLTKKGGFTRFDYDGAQPNIDHYGVDYPPKIDLTKIAKVPVAMFVGDKDTVSTAADAEVTKADVATNVFYKVYPNMDHDSFAIGKDMSYVTDMNTLLAKYNIFDKKDKPEHEMNLY